MRFVTIHKPMFMGSCPPGVGSTWRIFLYIVLAMLKDSQTP
nr:MAG TPA: hypothetical protein [Caudoviricetes sp.]